MPEYDPTVFVELPGAPGSFTTRSTLAPCPCGRAEFEIVVADNGRPSCQCPGCCPRRGRVVGFLDMGTGLGRIAAGGGPVPK